MDISIKICLMLLGIMIPLFLALAGVVAYEYGLLEEALGYRRRRGRHGRRQA